MQARPTGLTKDAGWQIGVSRTLPQPPSAVWEFVSGPEGLALWLGAGAGAELTPERGAPYRLADGTSGEVRGYRPGDRIRVTRGTTTVQVAVTPSPSGTGTVLRLHQERLASQEERERQRAHWQDVAARIAEALAR